MKWHLIAPFTYAMVVPGGMVIRYLYGSSVAMEFVPTPKIFDYNLCADWIERNRYGSADSQAQ